MSIALRSVIISILALAAAPLRGDEGWKLLDRGIPDVSIVLLDSGRTSLLAFCRERPTMISLVYSQCAGICYPFLFELRDKGAEVGGGENDYQMLILSFDERETEHSLSAMAELAGLRHNPHWRFGIIDRTGIRRLTEGIGFTFEVDSLTGQIDHPPILVGVDARGRIVNIMKEFDITRNDLWQLYRQIREEYVPVSRESRPTLISCFTYDPRKGSTRFDWGMLLLYLPVASGGLIIWKIFSAAKR